MPVHASEINDQSRPNILLLFSDDQRADTIAALGNKFIQTPNLDRLVRSGVSFNRAYMQGALQPATCVPSRAMLLTGQSLFRIDEKLKRQETWPAAFAKAGYATFMTGKWHGPVDSVALSFQSARSVFVGGMTNPMTARLSDLQTGKLTQPRVTPQHTCAAFADEAIRFLQEKRDKPFFCYVPFNAPHDPHIVPESFPIRYDSTALPLLANFLPQHPFDNGEMIIRDEELLPWPRTASNVQRLNAEYYRYISYLDAQIGRILDALAASSSAQNTIVVFAADSGAARGSHGLIGKQSLYEHSIHVPLIISGPGIPKGKSTDALCYLFDVLPTLGTRCRVPGPRTSEGLDLNAVVDEPERAGRSRLFFAYRSVQRAVRDGRWKLIRYPQINKTQLFDLEKDPNEITDLSMRPELAGQVARMTAMLAEEMRRHSDPTPVSSPTPRRAEWTAPVR
jgi:arylsulfatase A-like enzyme